MAHYMGVIGDKVEKPMKKKIKYNNEPMDMEVIEDFLPPPEDLVLKEDTVKVTIGLSRARSSFLRPGRKGTARSIRK